MEQEHKRYPAPFCSPQKCTKRLNHLFQSHWAPQWHSLAAALIFAISASWWLLAWLSFVVVSATLARDKGQNYSPGGQAVSCANPDSIYLSFRNKSIRNCNYQHDKQAPRLPRITKMKQEVQKEIFQQTNTSQDGQPFNWYKRMHGARKGQCQPLMQR